MRALVQVLCVLALAGSSVADELSFDFSDGIGPNFAVRNDDGRWDVSSDSTGLRVSWDSGSGEPFPLSVDQGGIGGVDGLFTVDGDFAITVDYSLHDFPVLSFPGLIDSVLGVGPVQAGVGKQFEVLRFATRNGQYIEGYDTMPGVQLGVQANSDTAGKFRIVRTGSTIGGYFATGTSDTFTLLGSRSSGFDGPLAVFLIGFYSIRAGDGEGLTFDMSFNNLEVEADQINGLVADPVPEPGTLALFGAALVGLALWRRLP